MSQRYKISVDKQFAFELTEQEVNQTDIVKTSDHSYHVIDQLKSINAEVVQTDFNGKKYVIHIQGADYEVHIKDEIDALIDDMGFSISAVKQVNEIKAPMPGLILDISIEVGQSVDENQMLIILEAMKMENTMLSPRAGIVKSVEVIKGQAVEKGQTLITFE